MLYIHNSPHYQSVLVDYENIVRILKLSEYILAISAGESDDILYSIRAEVNDFFQSLQTISSCRYSQPKAS